MGCRKGDSVLSQQWRELHRTYEPAWTVPMIPTIEHAWVLETAGSQLITARSEHITLHHDAGYMSEHRFRSLVLLEPARSQLITARSDIMLHHDAKILRALQRATSRHSA